ncbi:MAG: DUF6198 family protein [Defluviitaleaceae bacterium]|nr:DUF6198 family protein [Defluviitaleaceae bacterium]
MAIKAGNLVKRGILYVLGLLVAAFGVAFAINSNLGLSPMNSFPYVLSQVSGINMGTWVTSLLIFYILLQVIILRKEFRLVDVLQFLFAFIFGYFVDFTRWIIGDFRIPTYVGQLVMLLFAIVLIATGITLFMRAQLVNLPTEGLVDAISKKVEKPFGKVAVVVHTFTVLLGIVISFVFLGQVTGIREGTVLSALLIGKLIPHIHKIVTPTLVKLGI